MARFSRDSKNAPTARADNGAQSVDTLAPTPPPPSIDQQTRPRKTKQSGPPPSPPADNPGGRRAGRPRPEAIEVRVRDVLVHRTPPSVARSLRYLLAGGELPPRFAVTSSIHGEGATTIARSLAALIAYDWRESVCWVDLNWWKVNPLRQETALFDTTLADVVERRAPRVALAMPTSIPGLSMVTAGDVPLATRARLPKSDELAEILDELSRSFDHIVLDLPPVLASSDAVSLSAYGAGYFLVVRQKSTSSVQVRAALQTLSAVPCLGTILNDARSNVPRWLRTSNEVWALGT
jgi:Mrp family chromosome partitioning ATPase